MVVMNKIINEDIDKILKSDISWNNLSGKSFLIAGANGMIPSYLVYVILQLNKRQSTKSKVLAIVRNKKDAEERFQNFLNDDNLMIIQQDISKGISLDEKVDVIIHAASQASPKYFGNDPVGTILPNVIGTKNLLELASHHKLECFLFLSSGEVYGKIIQDRITETDYGFLDPLELRSCYAESKRMGENMCISWSKQYDIPIKIARIFHTYGPTMKLDDGRVFADFVSNVVKNENIIIKSDGSAKRPFCYISDTITGLFTILTKGINGHAYNISNPNSLVSINELAKIICNLFPEKKLKIIRHKQYQNGYLESKIDIQNPDITKLKKLGWSPTISIEEGFFRTIVSFDKNVT